VLPFPVSLDKGRGGLDLSDGWPDRWIVTWKYAGEPAATGPNSSPISSAVIGARNVDETWKHLSGVSASTDGRRNLPDL
jgi:hypothetical protein